MSVIIQERLDKLPTLQLAHGGHDSFAQGACAMEMVSWLAGEKYSDHPECACPVISTFMRTWNDNLGDADRTRLLLPLVPKLVGTKRDEATESSRAAMAADWMVRVHTPAWLRLAGLAQHADALEALPEIIDFAKTPALKPILEAVRIDAAAAWDAAGAAARAAAWDAARAAAWAAAWDAAGAAAGAKLRPTVERLQRSAAVLIKRMIAA